MTVYFVAKRMIARHRPDHVVVFNRLYSANHAFCVVAEREGIPTLHAAGRRTHLPPRRDYDDVPRLQVARGRLRDRCVARLQHTSDRCGRGQSRRRALQRTARGVERIRPRVPSRRAIRRRCVGASTRSRGAPSCSSPCRAKTRSTPRGSRMPSLSRAGRRRCSPVSSSGSGSCSSTRNLTPIVTSSFACTRACSRISAKNVRSIVDELMSILDSRPANVSLNVPGDEVSLYDIMQIVDVVLSFRSSVGAQARCFRHPVVVPSNADFFTYPKRSTSSDPDRGIRGEDRRRHRVGMVDREHSPRISLVRLPVQPHRRRLLARFRNARSQSARRNPDCACGSGARPSTSSSSSAHSFVSGSRCATDGSRCRVETFLDVFENDRNNLAESALWMPVVSTNAQEAAL